MILSETPRIEFLRMDCMELMRNTPDKFYDLAIVDPPYGINVAKNGSVGGGKLAKVKNHGSKNWDNKIPEKKYFDELFRTSKNQIIWGWNYFVCHLSSCPSYIVWDKNNTGNFSDCESAWCSVSGGARLYKYTWNGMLQENMKEKEIRIHHTQKPIQLYKWLLTNYAKPGDKILDTHAGSFSSGIACYRMGFDMTACEIDQEYYDDAVKRFKLNTSQTTIF